MGALAASEMAEPACHTETQMLPIVQDASSGSALECSTDLKDMQQRSAPEDKLQPVQHLERLD